MSGEALEVGCPCCLGHNAGEWMDLCDDCLSAWLAGAQDHDCARPAEIVDVAEDWRRGHIPQRVSPAVDDDTQHREAQPGA